MAEVELERGGRPDEGLGRRLRELAGLFLKLGVVAFGGPAAHIAMMEDEVVARRGWLSRREFLDLIAAAHLIPGPNSTELAIHVGRSRAGVAGLLVAGSCFIVPAAAMVGALAWAYVEFGHRPTAEGLLAGVKPVVIAIVAQALWRLGRSALRSWEVVVVAAAATLTYALGVHELVVLGAAGVAVLLLRTGRGPLRGASVLALGLPAPGLAAAGGAAAAPVTLSGIFLFFLKVGAVLFGSGYVLLAFLRADLVERLGWLTEAQLLDAVAIGQVTPGPVFTTATFIGYLLDGVTGAVVATVGIFLPGFLLVALTGPILEWLRRQPALSALLDGLVAGSLALMAVVTYRLGEAALATPLAWVLAVCSLVLLLRFQVGSAWLVLGGAVVGLLAGL